MATLNALAMPATNLAAALPLLLPIPARFCRSNCLLIQALGSRLYALQGVNQSSVYLRLLSACYALALALTSPQSLTLNVHTHTHPDSGTERDKLQLLIAHAASYVPMPKLRIRHAALTTTVHILARTHTARTPILANTCCAN